MSRDRLIVYAMTIVGLAMAAPAQAQFESALGSVTDVNLFSSCLSTNSPLLRRSGDCIKQNSFGIEVLWGLKTFHLGTRPDSTFSWRLTEKEVTYRGAGEDSVRRYVRSKAEAKPGALWGRVELEMALGYSQLSGFESARPEFELRGTVRELPALALYGTFVWERAPAVKPYLGVRSGLIQLHNLQALVATAPDTTVTYLGTAQVFQLGGAAGVAVGREPLHLVVEYAYNARRFGSIQWTGTGTRVPNVLPRELDFTGPSVSLGIQLHIREPK
jgi:hypothetical protein